MDIAHDVCTSIESTLRWKYDQENVQLVRPESRFENDFGFDNNNDYEILRGNLDEMYSTPISVREMKKMNASNLVEEVARYIGKLNSF